MSRALALVLDIDGTIIGNVATQRSIYGLLSKEYEIAGIPLRPHFLEFVRGLPEAELFVYTASEAQWAEELVSYIEKRHGISFNRPLFTRPNTIWTGNEYQKTLKNIMPVIRNTMRHKHKEAFDVVIVDNSNCYAPEDLPFLINCPTYNNAVRTDIKKAIPRKAYLGNREHMDGHLMLYLNSDTRPSSYEDFVRMLRNLNSFSFKNINDAFWKELGGLLKASKNIDRGALKSIRRALCR